MILTVIEAHDRLSRFICRVISYLIIYLRLISLILRIMVISVLLSRTYFTWLQDKLVILEAVVEDFGSLLLFRGLY